MQRLSIDLTEADLDFLIGVAAPDVENKAGLKQLLQKDVDFRNAFIDDERTFQKVTSNEEVFVKISPRLYFEILLRRTRKDLEDIGHTIERIGSQKIAVFDTREVVDLLSRQRVLVYLADMLSSFTRVESYTVTYRVKEGIWRKIRFNDLDIDSLIRFCESVEEEHRLAIFKRIADICLFVLGLFPEYVHYSYRYPLSGEVRPQMFGWVRRSPEEYEEEGKRFYELAAEHPAARSGDLSGIFSILHENFHAAKKPLNFISEHYLLYRRRSLFGLEPL